VDAHCALSSVTCSGSNAVKSLTDNYDIRRLWRRPTTSDGRGRATAGLSDTRTPGARHTASRRLELRPGVSDMQPGLDQRHGHTDRGRGIFAAGDRDHRGGGPGPNPGDKRLQL